MTEAFLNYLKYEKRYSDKTVESYKIDILQFFHFIQTEYQVGDLLVATNAIIRTWVVELVNKGQKPTSVKRKVSALKSYYKYHQKIGAIKTNPAGKINTPKIPDKLPKFVLERELKDLLIEKPDSYFKEGFEGIQEKLIVDMLYSTGMRRQELISLVWQDINFGLKQVKVTGKGNKQRIIPLGNELLNSLQIFKQQQAEHLKYIPTEPYIFLTKSGEQVYDKYVYRLVSKHLKNCSTVEKKSPHVLRHSFATHMSNNGAKLNDIKELLGHASLASTQVYTHNTIEQLKEIYKKAHPKA